MTWRVVYRSRVYMPPALLHSYETGHLLTADLLHDVTTDQLTALIQWTDLILLDFVTSHYDRYYDTFAQSVHVNAVLTTQYEPHS